MSVDPPAHLRLIALVQGASHALVAQIEDELPMLPWCDRLRKVVAKDLESEIASAVASVCERLVLAMATPGLKLDGEDEPDA